MYTRFNRRSEEKIKRDVSEIIIKKIRDDIYFSIDMEETGKMLKQYINKSDYTVKEIQHYLYLSCPQPIYRWLKGRILPSVEHLFMLSKLFKVHMEDLLVQQQLDCLEIKLEYNKIIVIQENVKNCISEYIKVYVNMLL